MPLAARTHQWTLCPPDLAGWKPALFVRFGRASAWLGTGGRSLFASRPSRQAREAHTDFPTSNYKRKRARHCSNSCRGEPSTSSRRTSSRRRFSFNLPGYLHLLSCCYTSRAHARTHIRTHTHTHSHIHTHTSTHAHTHTHISPRVMEHFRGRGQTVSAFSAALHLANV